MPATPTADPSIITESVQTASMRAMGLLASGRTWLILLITIAVLLQIGLFAAANWGDVLHKRSVVQAEANALAAQADADAPPAEPAASQPAGNVLQTFWPAEKWQRAMEIALPIAGLATVLSVLVLVVVTIVGIQVNLVGRLPGIPAAISAFYWSLLTAVLVMPWGRLLGGVFLEKLPWMFCSYKDIDAAVTAMSNPATAPGVIWWRFLAWPAFALVAAWICGARFGNAYWQVVSLAEMQAKAEPKP